MALGAARHPAPGVPVRAVQRRVVTVAYHPRYDRRDPATIVGAVRRTVYDDLRCDTALLTAAEYHRATDLPTAERDGQPVDALALTDILAKLDAATDECRPPDAVHARANRRKREGLR